MKNNNNSNDEMNCIYCGELFNKNFLTGNQRRVLNEEEGKSMENCYNLIQPMSSFRELKCTACNKIMVLGLCKETEEHIKTETGAYYKILPKKLFPIICENF